MQEVKAQLTKACTRQMGAHIGIDVRASENQKPMMYALRLTFAGFIFAVCIQVHTAPTSAQQVAVELRVSNDLPDAPRPQTSESEDSGVIRGTVKDNSGAVITGASIMLEATTSTDSRSAKSDDSGTFNFTNLNPSTYRVTVTAQGFATWISSAVTIRAGEQFELPFIVLEVASASSSVNVSISQHDVAEEQIKEEERQRIAGIFPEFYVSYIWNAAPLSTGQKFELAWKSTTDPTTFAITGVIASYEQARNNLRAYGQGAQGFAKRYGANYADSFSSIMIGSALLPSLFHQDPRYFVKGTGSFQSRALHAMAFPFITRGDNRRAQPNFSVVLGTYASAELSNLYYPSSSQTHVTSNNMLLGIGLDSVNSLLLEFVYPHLTSSAPRSIAANTQLVLREGTPVSLIVSEDLSLADVRQGKPVVFALLRDVKVGGVIVARAGSRASGDVIAVAMMSNEIKTDRLPIQFLSLQAGEERVPLRASKRRTGEDEVSYRPLNRTVATAGANKKIQIHAGTLLTAYIASDISLHPAL
ncbi:MAG: carboxypeptidase-like regulatory domain-containing protein [Terracidiphilus sp.]|nr:carboxypeptidase-like regulatory domain-containing protein [Terracidiphilus sp.]